MVLDWPCDDMPKIRQQFFEKKTASSSLDPVKLSELKMIRKERGAL